MPNEDAPLEKEVNALSTSLQDFFATFTKMVQANEAKNGVEGIRAMLASTRKARKLSDDLLQYAEAVEDFFGL